MANANMFLKTFCELELTWLADKNTWLNAKEGHFVYSVMLFMEAWSTISKNREKYTLLSKDNFTLLKQLCEKIEKFQNGLNDLPHSEKECRALVNNREWMSIQQDAKDVRDKIYSMLAFVVC